MNLDDLLSSSYPSKPIYKFCPKCKNKAWLNDDHDCHNRESTCDYISIEGIFVAFDVVSQSKEKKLLELIDTRQPWCPSQEGRFKQDYGPKVNFLQQKVSLGNFSGFPDFAIDLFNKLQSDYYDELANFIPVELCFLEYTSNRQSYIRPHFDDKWIWGDRLVTINLNSDTFLRLTKEFNQPPYEIAVPMPARSLTIIKGEARNDWLHSINSYDIKGRRVAMTWREFGNKILSESQHEGFINETIRITKRSINH